MARVSRSSSRIVSTLVLLASAGYLLAGFRCVAPGSAWTQPSPKAVSSSQQKLASKATAQVADSPRTPEEAFAIQEENLNAETVKRWAHPGIEDANLEMLGLASFAILLVLIGVVSFK
mmetsp:Transcript_8026/g.17917  ORF Transcript_8026/g.17917 Transcript_8026/m.17917 type:complete len:118 (+) Transcript_8026:112-465(+)